MMKTIKSSPVGDYGVSYFYHTKDSLHLHIHPTVQPFFDYFDYFDYFGLFFLCACVLVCLSAFEF